jgi:hypothetical protein
LPSFFDFPAGIIAERYPDVHHRSIRPGILRDRFLRLPSLPGHSIGLLIQVKRKPIHLSWKYGTEKQDIQKIYTPGHPFSGTPSTP